MTTSLTRISGMDTTNAQINPQLLKFQGITIDQIAELSFSETISTDSGWYPLHILCRKNDHDIITSRHFSNERDYLDLIGKVIQSYPEAVSQETKEGWLPLHILCRNAVQNKYAIHKVLSTYREAARIPVHSDGWYPLHQVCKYSESVDVIIIIYDAYPIAVKKRSLRGKFPFQLLQFNRAFETAGFYDAVIAACPLLGVNQLLDRAAVPVVEAVEMTDEESMMFSDSDNLQQYVISTKAYRETAQTPIKGGLYLLHALCQQSAPFREIIEALNAFPQAASMATDDGWLPLHLVCRNSDDFTTVQTILEAYPRGAAVATSEGWYPLHQLCRYSHSLEAIKMMYEAYPQASRGVTMKGTTPLDMLLKYHSLRTDTGKSLVNTDPNYEKDLALALSVKILSGHEEETHGAVASPIGHSAFMEIVKFEDICNLLDNGRK